MAPNTRESPGISEEKPGEVSGQNLWRKCDLKGSKKPENHTNNGPKAPEIHTKTPKLCQNSKDCLEKHQEKSRENSD